MHVTHKLYFSPPKCDLLPTAEEGARGSLLAYVLPRRVKLIFLLSKWSIPEWIKMQLLYLPFIKVKFYSFYF